jgi:hypothetical protein
VSRKAIVGAFVVAIVATAVGSVLLPVGFLSSSGVAAGALRAWALLLAPGICLLGLAFPPDFLDSHYRLALTIGLTFNVLAWTGVVYAVMVLVARMRRNVSQRPAGPA